MQVVWVVVHGVAPLRHMPHPPHPTDVRPHRFMHQCPCCWRTFRTRHGLSTHIGMVHRDWSPEAGQQDGSGAAPHKRARREAEAPPPVCPAFDAAVWEDGDADGAMDADWGEEPGDLADGAAEQQAELCRIRAQARQLLTQPSWQKWAEDMLEWAEDGILGHVHEMFPEAAHFETPETFRFLQLRSLHPGSAFAKELLAAAHEEQLDLQKVCCATPYPPHPHL